ncbi:MAG TPA: tetratricopeptide repeat protein [Verrucomicrobiae bacterium]|jgi:tetratricopeptide (TPR) repeat protein
MTLTNPTNTAGVPDVSGEVFKRCLLGLFLLGLIVRVFFLVEHARSPSFGVPTLDQKYYDTAARMLLAGEDLHRLHGMRPLLYPIFLAALYKIGGSFGIELAVTAQHLLGVLTGVLVALIGARLFRHRLGGVAGGVLYMLAPVPLYFEGELLIESSYVFLICAGLWLILRAEEKDSVWLWLACGALTALTAQARANILVFMAVYPLLAGWRWWRARQPAAMLPLLGLLGGICMGIPWGFVNKMQSDHFQVIPSAGGVNLYLGNRRGADGMTLELDRYVNYDERFEDPVDVWARQQYEGAMRMEGRQPSANPMAVSHYWTQRTLGEIKDAPAAWLKLMARKCWLMLWNAEVPNNKAFAFLQTEFVALRALPVRWVVLLMLAPAGIWAACKWGDRETLFVLLVYLGLYFAGTAAFFICDRFRYPLWPVLASISGGGLLALWRWRWALGLAAGAVLMAAVSLPDWFGAKLPSFALDYRLRSIAWYEKGHFPEALSDIDRSLALNPGDMTSLHHRGNVLLALNRLEDARQDYERTLKISAEDGGLWNNYGVALEGLGLTNQAMEAFRKATECHPPSQNAFLGLSFGNVRAGRLDAAAAALDQLERLEGKPGAAVLAVRSVVARLRGQVPAADALEKQARALDADEAAWAMKRAKAGP